MSTILLPAIRRETVNLFHYSLAGCVTKTLTANAFGANVSTAASRILLTDAGLSVGDVVSGRGQIKNDSAGETCLMEIIAYNAADSLIGAKVSSTEERSDWTDVEIDAFTIPADTSYLVLRVKLASGTGTAAIRNGMINRGPTAQPYDIPKRGALVPWQIPVRFGREHEQALSRTMTGVSQVTSYPSRRWLMSGETEILVEGELREWLVALDQLSDLANTFRHVVPDYDGPSTGYRGANPLVNGAGQLGTSLICDGVDASTAIAKAGDYASFDVTSPRGNTNSQLFRLKSDATSDASGNVTFTFTTPIRQAPADNAVLQIFAPVAQFGLVSPVHAYDLQMKRMASLEIAAEERVLP